MTKSVAVAFLILSIVTPGLSNEAAPTQRSHVEASAYVLGPSDVITIQALDVEEISNKPIWIDTNGFINLPLVGRLKAAGLSAQELEAQLNTHLKAFVKEPHAVVSITEFRSQPVSVLGMVNTPGVHQVQGRKNVLEVLSMAGGIRPDAGRVAKITRRLDYGEIPLPGAATDASGQFSVAELQLKGIVEGRTPEQNIQVRPHDVISIPKADILYIVGEVKKPGGFVLSDRRPTVVEAVAMAEGLLPDANRSKVELLRLIPGQDERTRTQLKLDKIMAGKEADVALQAEDILIFPNSMKRVIKRRVGETVLSTITSMAIWGGF